MGIIIRSTLGDIFRMSNRFDMLVIQVQADLRKIAVTNQIMMITILFGSRDQK